MTAYERRDYKQGQKQGEYLERKNLFEGNAIEVGVHVVVR